MSSNEVNMGLVNCVDEYWYNDEACKVTDSWKNNHLIKNRTYYLENIPDYIYAFRFYDLKKKKVPYTRNNEVIKRFILDEEKFSEGQLVYIFDEERLNESDLIYIGQRLKCLNKEVIIDKYGVVHYDIDNAITLDEYINKLKRENKVKKLERKDIR